MSYKHYPALLYMLHDLNPVHVKSKSVSNLRVLVKHKRPAERTMRVNVTERRMMFP